jgi:hypothetical protein
VRRSGGKMEERSGGAPAAPPRHDTQQRTRLGEARLGLDNASTLMIITGAEWAQICL